MAFEKAFIPYGVYWSTPFCRWQGSLGRLSSLELAAKVARQTLTDKRVAFERLDNLILGFTVPQVQSFYGAPWVAAMLGAPHLSGSCVAQACSTSARVLAMASQEVETGLRRCVIGITCDRTSNGPHIYYPDPKGIGGMGVTENPVWDNFNKDPWAGLAMIGTAENVAKEAGISREEQDEVTLLRYQQYQAALDHERAFQKRYMVAVPVPKGRKETVSVDQDEGPHPTSAEGLAKLRPVVPGGTVTFGSQTFPADGNAGVVVCSQQMAKELSHDPNLPIRILAFADVRTKKGFMPMAVVPAARHALQMASIGIEDCKAIKSHNPFAVNDVYFCREMGIEPKRMNNYGSPLIYGHPQAPTGMRVIVELIEELVMLGGGHGLFAGCAAGDTAMSVVVKVG